MKSYEFKRRGDTRWWEWLATAVAILFILAIVLGVIPGCASPLALQENRHKNDQKYWGELSDIIDQSNASRVGQ